MLGKIIDKINKVIEAVSVVGFAAIAVLLFYQSISRYLFGHAYFWIEELSRNFMIIMALGGSVICVRKHAHTRIEYFVMKIPGITGKIVSTIATGSCLVLSVALCYYSLFTAKSKMMMNLSSVAIPAGIFTYFITISMALMAVGFLLDLIETWRKKEDGNK